MAEEEATLSQARTGTMKDVVELMPRGAPKAVVALVKDGELNDVDTLAYTDEELFTYETYCHNVNMRSPPKEVVTIYDVPREDGQVVHLQEAVNAPTQSYGNYKLLIGTSTGEIKNIPFELLPVSEPDPKPVYEHMGGDYYANDNGYYYLTKDKFYVQLTDFRIKVVERRITTNVNGQVEDEVHFILYDDEGWQETGHIVYSKWATDLLRYIREKAPTRILGLTHMSSAYFDQLFAYLLRTSAFPTNYFVSHWGWGAFEPSGRKFWHGGLKGCKSSKMLCPPVEDKLYRNNLLRMAFNFTEIGPRASVLLLYSCAAYQDAIFTDAGHFLSHSIMLIGSSGLLKTATVREVFNVFTVKNDRITSVRSTEASLHVMTEKAYDDTLVIDDFNREGSRQEIAQKIKNIQTLVRSYSEKVSRSKYGGNDNVKKYAIRGGLVITGETNMTGELKSGMLRYIKISINKRFDGDLLKTYQNNPQIMQVFFSEFIRFLEANYSNLVNFVSSNFDEYRMKFVELKEPRIIDAGVHLLMTAQIMVRFLTETGVLNNTESNGWLNSFERDLLEILRHQSEEVKTTDPYILYVKQVWELINTGEIELAADVDRYKADLKRYIGYVDGDLLMFEKDNLYREVVNACRAKDEYLTMSSDEVLKILKEKGISECNKGSNLRKASARLSDPNKGISRPLMLALRRYACEKLLEINE